MAIEDKEQGNLIGSDKVEGTAVYGANSEKIGSIERVMIDKPSGRVSYAVLAFGGFLGVGHDHYPLPWQSLKYNTQLGGYQTMVTLYDYGMVNHLVDGLMMRSWTQDEYNAMMRNWSPKSTRARTSLMLLLTRSWTIRLLR